MSGGNDKHERELESFLADDSRVAALYRRLPKDEPDARLDAKILAQARAAVQPRRARSRWLPAMSAAAALVVVAGLAYRVGPQVWNEGSGVSEKAGQNVAAPATVSAQPASDASAQLGAQASQSDGALAVPQTAPAAAMKRAMPGTAQNEPEHVEAQRQRRETAETLYAESHAMQEQKLSAKTQHAQTPSSTNAEEQDKKAVRDNVAAAPAQQTMQTPSPAPARAAALPSPPRLDAAPAPPAPSASETSASSTTNAAPRVANPFPAAAAYAPMSAPAPAAAPARELAKPSPSTADVEVNLYPEHWITDIRTLMKNGHRDDALRNLAAFRKRYPDYKLPNDLRDLK